MGIIRLNRHQILAVARLTKDVINNFTMYQAESLEIVDGDNADNFYVKMKIKEGEVISEWKKDGNVKLISVNLIEKEEL